MDVFVVGMSRRLSCGQKGGDTMEGIVLTQFAGQIAMMALTGVVGWLAGKIKGAKQERQDTQRKEQEERDRSRDVQRLLLYYRIHDLFVKFVVNAQSITSAEKHEIEELYELYRELGGNGEGQRMYKELMALKTT